MIPQWIKDSRTFLMGTAIILLGLLCGNMGYPEVATPMIVGGAAMLGLRTVYEKVNDMNGGKKRG